LLPEGGAREEKDRDHVLHTPLFSPKRAAHALKQCATMLLDAECAAVNGPYRGERLRW
jgi:hypothetical protein